MIKDGEKKKNRITNHSDLDRLQKKSFDTSAAALPVSLIYIYFCCYKKYFFGNFNIHN